MRYAYQESTTTLVTDHNITPLIHSSPRHEYNRFLLEFVTEVFHLQRYKWPGLGTSSKTDSQLKHGLVDCNLHRVAVSKPNQNGPNTDKRCIRFTYTDVMGVLEPSLGNGGIGMQDSFLCND